MAALSTLNQEYFNNLASEYDSRFGDTIAQLEGIIREAKDFIGMKEHGRVLDYACGTGLLSRALQSQADECVGIDVSENMVGAYNARAQEAGLYPDGRRAYVGNLILPSDPRPSAFTAPEFGSFDLASVTSGFHHFDDCDLAAKRLTERLRPGGVLLIVDFLPHGGDEGGGSASLASSGVAHHGFTEERISEMFAGAGCGADFAFRALPEKVVFEDKKSGRKMARGLFLARGSKF